MRSDVVCFRTFSASIPVTVEYIKKIRFHGLNVLGSSVMESDSETVESVRKATTRWAGCLDTVKGSYYDENEQLIESMLGRRGSTRPDTPEPSRIRLEKKSLIDGRSISNTANSL